MPDPEWLCIFKSCPLELTSHHLYPGWRGQMWHICCDTLLYHQPVAGGDSCPSSFPAAGQHNDARMNLAIALTAARYGAATANYMEVLSLLKKTDPETGKERVSGVRCKDILTGMPRLWQGALLSILPCLYNDWIIIFLSLLFDLSRFQSHLNYILIVNSDWFNVKIFPCGTWQFTLNNDDDSNDNKMQS